MNDTEQNSPLRFYLQKHSIDWMDFYQDIWGLFEGRKDRLTKKDYAAILRKFADEIDPQ